MRRAFTIYKSYPKKETIFNYKEKEPVEWARESGMASIGAYLPRYDIPKWDATPPANYPNIEPRPNGWTVTPHFFTFMDEASQVAFEMLFPGLYEHKSHTFTVPSNEAEGAGQ